VRGVASCPSGPDVAGTGPRSDGGAARGAAECCAEGERARSIRLGSDLLDRTERLVGVPSLSGEETALADLLEGELRSASHLQVTRIGDNLVARTGLGRSRRVVLAGHLDTVPGAPGVRRERDRVVGLGAADMKGGLAVLWWLAAVATAQSVDATFVFYTCEEVSHERSGLEEVHRRHPELLAGDVAPLLFSRGAVIVSGPTEQGALLIWCAKSKAAEELGAPAARDIGFYSAPGDSGFRTILSVLREFGIPWVVVCDGKSFDVETNWSNHIFRQIEQAGVDFPELKGFTQRTGNGGKDQRRMTQALWDEQVDLGVRHGVFTLATSWTGSAEAVEGFIEGAAPGKLAEAKAEVGESKIRKGRWVAQQTDCAAEIDDLYRKIIATLDRALVDAPSSRESPSQPDGTVAR
jgi:hypothetical protein